MRAIFFPKWNECGKKYSNRRTEFFYKDFLGIQEIELRFFYIIGCPVGKIDFASDLVFKHMCKLYADCRIKIKFRSMVCTIVSSYLHHQKVFSAYNSCLELLNDMAVPLSVLYFEIYILIQSAYYCCWQNNTFPALFNKSRMNMQVNSQVRGLKNWKNSSINNVCMSGYAALKAMINDTNSTFGFLKITLYSFLSHCIV